MVIVCITKQHFNVIFCLFLSLWTELKTGALHQKETDRDRGHTALEQRSEVTSS